MRTTSVTAHYERKLNTGNFSSVTLSAWATVEVDEGDDADGALAYAMHLCREQVKDAAGPFVRNGKKDEQQTEAEAPGIFGGAPVYTPEEVGADIDPDGNVVEGVIIQATPQPAIAAPATPDDEAIITEVTAKEFMNAAAALLEVDTDTLRERLHALGYERIPGKPEERLTMYKRLRDEQPVAQGEMFESADNGAYQE